MDPLHTQQRAALVHGLGALKAAHVQQRAGIVLARRLDDLAGLAVFDRLAMAQHHDLVGDLGDDGQIMRDVKRGGAGFLDGVLDGGQHVKLGGHVQRRRRLVEDDQIGARAQRHRRHRPLQLPARDLMRIAVAEMVGVGQAKRGEKAARAGLGLGAGHEAVQQRGLDHLVHQPVRRVEGGGGRLRDIADAAAAQLADAAPVQRQDVLTVDHHLTARDAHAAAPIGQCGKADGGLARAGFADQAKDAAPGQVEADALDDLDFARRLVRRKDAGRDAQVAHLQKITHQPRPPFRLDVRCKSQSTTRLTDTASAAIAAPG